MARRLEKSSDTYLGVSLGLAACLRRPSAFLLKAVFDCCLPGLIPAALDMLPSLLGAPFTTVVDMLGGLAGCRRSLPTTGPLKTVWPRHTTITLVQVCLTGDQ